MSKVWRLRSKGFERRSDAERKWTAVPPQSANTSRTLQSPKVHGAGNTEPGRFLSFLSKVRSPRDFSFQIFAATISTLVEESLRSRVRSQSIHRYIVSFRLIATCGSRLAT